MLRYRCLLHAPATGPLSVKQNSAHFTATAGRAVTRPHGGRSPLPLAASYVLPSGYPKSVRPGFVRFYSCFVANTALTAFGGSVATSALLSGFFIESTAASWLLKDLVPTVLAATMANVVFAYHRSVKFWFVAGAVITQLATVCDFLIPILVPSGWLLPAAAGTAFLKGSTMIMTQVTRTSILQHFAKVQNIGDLSNKFSSAGMLTYTLSGAAGLMFASSAPSVLHGPAVVLCCAGSACISAVAVRDIAFVTLTPQSFGVLARRFRNDQPLLSPTEWDALPESAKAEHAQESDTPLLGPPLQTVTAAPDFQDGRHAWACECAAPSSHLWQMSENSGASSSSASKTPSERKGETDTGPRPRCVVVAEECTFDELAECYIEALSAGRTLTSGTTSPSSSDSTSSSSSSASGSTSPAITGAAFCASLRAAGWDTTVAPDPVEMRVGVVVSPTPGK